MIALFNLVRTLGGTYGTTPTCEDEYESKAFDTRSFLENENRLRSTPVLAEALVPYVRASCRAGRGPGLARRVRQHTSCKCALCSRSMPRAAGNPLVLLSS
jgi:hypothetical protein